MDEAILTVNNELDIELVVSWMSERCYQVPDIPLHFFLWTYDLFQVRMVMVVLIWTLVSLCVSVCTSSWVLSPQDPVLASPVQ